MTTTTNENELKARKLAQANTIARQIGNGALFMMGAKNLIAHTTEENAALSFKIGRNDNGITHLKITLEPSDTYSIKFLKVRGLNVSTVAEVDMVFEDVLKQVIENRTGLRLSL